MYVHASRLGVAVCHYELFVWIHKVTDSSDEIKQYAIKFRKLYFINCEMLDYRPLSRNQKGKITARGVEQQRAPARTAWLVSKQKKKKEEKSCVRGNKRVSEPRRSFIVADEWLIFHRAKMPPLKVRKAQMHHVMISVQDGGDDAPKERDCPRSGASRRVKVRAEPQLEPGRWTGDANWVRHCIATATPHPPQRPAV